MILEFRDLGYDIPVDVYQPLPIEIHRFVGYYVLPGPVYYPRCRVVAAFVRPIGSKDVVGLSTE
ncbi:MAG: hypothetical protein P8Y98_14625 [Anaerolineales bacterium]